MNLILFDLDGTLAEATKQIKDDMKNKLREFKNKNFELGIVSGGTIEKIIYQVNDDNLFKFIFSENGMIGYENNEKIFEKRLEDEFSMHTLTLIYDKINMHLIDIFSRVNNYIQESTNVSILNLPKVEKRNSMLYLVPSGVGCDDLIRSNFMQLDNKEKIRVEIIKRLKDPLEKLGFSIKVGGNVGLAICPLGWDKSYILKNNILKMKDYEKIYFFGDKCKEDGNDYPIYSYKGIEGYHVTNPEHTLSLLCQNFK